MHAIEFEAYIQNGIIKIPGHYLAFKQQPKAKIIVMVEDGHIPSSTSLNNDFIAHLMNNPVTNHGLFLSREQSNER